MDVVKRIKLVKAMEFIARQVNDEGVFEPWLEYGVADGDIADGDLSVNAEDMEKYGVSWYTDDKRFAELMRLFLNVMAYAQKDGGLFCDNVLSDGRIILGDGRIVQGGT